MFNLTVTVLLLTLFKKRKLALYWITRFYLALTLTFANRIINVLCIYHDYMVFFGFTTL